MGFSSRTQVAVSLHVPGPYALHGACGILHGHGTIHSCCWFCEGLQPSKSLPARWRDFMQAALGSLAAALVQAPDSQIQIQPAAPAAGSTHGG